MKKCLYCYGKKFYSELVRIVWRRGQSTKIMYKPCPRCNRKGKESSREMS